MRVDRLLQSQGFGTRLECRALLEDGRVTINGEICRSISEDVVAEGLCFTVDGVEWSYREFAYLVMNKPANFECSHRPSHHPSVYSLLPIVLVRRGVQAVGRLDADTTGLLLLSDDGNFIHKFTSPKKSISKCYKVFTRHPVTEKQLVALRSGVVLHDDPEPIKAIECETIDSKILTITVTEGKYHLVKRMVAASGNRVERLHRLSIGNLSLPASLAEGTWQWLDGRDFECLNFSQTA